ncbi:MAG: hypothetical protein M0P16_00480 [Syntrophales bacterium]|jgi:hypothetical protein|nr:hypothetical protein [Syntrophales bacterium]MCK9390262.1 hypothetical protein [Syntrophales bacterium]
MPRELSNSPCEVTFDDRISGDKITLYYRTPTTAERVKYTNGYVTRQGNKIVSTVGELRMRAGSAILTGFKTGAFSVPGKGLISSTPTDNDYDPEWKSAVKQYAPDVIEMLAVIAFESSLVRSATARGDELEILPATEDDWNESPDLGLEAAGGAPEGASADNGVDGGSPLA